jgi:transcription initiation factor TFIIIB Brf1 subunit/transcription initiation factor TFIIB
MTQLTNELARFKISCPECAEKTEQTIAWYLARDSMTCEHCGCLISLKGTETGAKIKKLNEMCIQLDRGPRELD